MPAILLVDLDHTVSGASWRDVRIKPGMTSSDWDDYHSDLDCDPVIADTAILLRALHTSGIKIVFITSRPERYRMRTRRWLQKFNLPDQNMIMRPDADDYTPSSKLKTNQVLKEFGEHDFANILGIMDDREDVCLAFNEIGVTSFQVRVP